jgi:signal transduction histidine kinase
MGALRTLKLALAATIGLFAAAAVYISLTIAERQEALHQVSRYNIVWAASQALSEIQSFERLIEAAARPGARVDMDELKLRLDILFNRLEILKGGDFAHFLVAKPQQGKAVDSFAEALARLDALLVDNGAQAIAEAATLLAKPEQQIRRFAAAANQFSGEQVADDQSTLLRLHLVFSLLAAGLVLCGLAFIGLLFLQNRALGQAHGRLRALTDELRVAKDAAEQASDAKSRFLATMSHELRTPLNAVIGFSETILQQPFGPLGADKYVEYLKDIERSGRHMLELITDILTVAKMDAGRLKLHFAPLDSRELANAAIRIVQGTEAGRSRDVAVEPGGDWPALDADEGAMRQMLINLLSNAVKFSPSGTPVRLRGACRTDGGFVLTVQDRGIGMSNEDAALASQPFFQADSRLARKYGGTGLGLSIVKGLVERHGGELLIDSSIDEGTAISIALPPQRVERPPIAAVAGESQRGEVRRVLAHLQPPVQHGAPTARRPLAQVHGPARP